MSKDPQQDNMHPLTNAERLARLLLVMSLALYFAVSTGLWDAATNPTVDEKKARDISPQT